jgi:hypothetical protein
MAILSVEWTVGFSRPRGHVIPPADIEFFQRSNAANCDHRDLGQQWSTEACTIVRYALMGVAVYYSGQ